MRRREKKSTEQDGRQSGDEATPNGKERDDKMRQARRDQIASNIDQWASSAGLQKPD